MKHMFKDAQAYMSFVLSEATKVNKRVYEVKYPAIQYRGLIPVNTDGPEWIKSITYMSMDQAGQAAWVSAAADDVPHVALLRDKVETTVSMAAIGYDWNLEEVAQAAMLGIPLADRKAKAARRVSEEFIDKIAFVGDAVKGFYGVTNQPGVTAGDAAATGTGSATEWSTKTPGMILADVNAALNGIFIGTNNVEMADTILLPYAQYSLIGTTRLNDNGSEKTILQWVRENNAYTLQSGQPLTIRAYRGLETAGAGGTARMVAYRNDEEVLRLNMPMPFRFFPVWQQGPFRYEVPGAFRLGGVDVSLPSAIRYMDAI